MKKIATLGAVMALAMSGAALAADDVSYSFVEAGYGYSEIGGGMVLDGDGFNLAASIELPANFVVAASYRDYDYGPGNLSELSAGIGYKWALGSSFNLLTAASYENQDYGSGDEFSGFGIAVAVRGMVTDTVEIGASVKYNDLESPMPTFFSTSIGVRKYFNPSFAGGIEVRKSDFQIAGETSIIATLRYDFGKLF